MGAALPTVDLGVGLAVAQLVAGYGHTCALFTNGAVKCWGENSYGQLGLGDTKNRGYSAAEMGDALPTVNLGFGRTVVQLVAGEYHTCALFTDGAVKCWGYNFNGELGLGLNYQFGDSVGEMGDALPTVDLGASLVLPYPPPSPPRPPSRACVTASARVLLPTSPPRARTHARTHARTRFRHGILCGRGLLAERSTPASPFTTFTSLTSTSPAVSTSASTSTSTTATATTTAASPLSTITSTAAAPSPAALRRGDNAADNEDVAVEHPVPRPGGREL